MQAPTYVEGGARWVTVRQCGYRVVAMVLLIPVNPASLVLSQYTGGTNGMLLPPPYGVER